jgi:hypothetical protein
MRAASFHAAAMADEGEIKRIFGSWEQVHPASAGAQSQESLFMLSAFNASRDHPASFAIRNTEGGDDPADESNILMGKRQKKSLPDGLELRELGMKTLTAPAGTGGHFDAYRNDPNAKWFICESVRELALLEPRRVRNKIVLIAKKDQMTLYECKEAILQARQSRAHRFDLPDRDDARILDITVSIVFQGQFGTRGYKLGRLAAGLFRMPDERDPDSSPLPIPVGYAPYALQSPNLPEVMGRVVIHHKPQARPLKPGTRTPIFIFVFYFPVYMYVYLCMYIMYLYTQAASKWWWAPHRALNTA